MRIKFRPPRLLRVSGRPVAVDLTDRPERVSERVDQTTSSSKPTNPGAWTHGGRGIAEQSRAEQRRGGRTHAHAMSGSSPLSQPPWLHPSNPTLDPPNSRARFLDGAARFGAGWSRAPSSARANRTAAGSPRFGAGFVCRSPQLCRPAGNARRSFICLSSPQHVFLPARRREKKEGFLGETVGFDR
jgi:hypothetical protein